MVVATKRKILPPSRKSKKPRQGVEEESEEADSVDNTSEERSSGDESEEEREEETSINDGVPCPRRATQIQSRSAWR